LYACAGNCAGDFVSNLAIARSARLNTAMTAVYAGPLLDILIAIPMGFWVLLHRAGNDAGEGGAPVATPAEPAPVATGAAGGGAGVGDAAVGAGALTPAVAAAGAMLLVHSMGTLVIARVNNGFLPRWFGRVALVTYAMYLVIVVALIMRYHT
jgi:Ca2+/Na+ antiporter